MKTMIKNKVDYIYIYINDLLKRLFLFDTYIYI